MASRESYLIMEKCVNDYKIHPRCKMYVVTTIRKNHLRVHIKMYIPRLQPRTPESEFG